MSPPLRRAALALAVALAGLAILGGCGDGGGEPLTKAEFVAKGDEICKQAHQKYRQLQQSPPRTPEEAAALTENLITISDDELSRIRNLNAPDEVQQALGRYLEAREQGISVLEQGLEAAQDENARAYAAAQAKISAGQVHRAKLAREVGFDECSRPGGVSG